MEALAGLPFLVLLIIILVWIVASVLMPLFVWGCYRELKAHKIYLREISDLLMRDNPPPKPTPPIV